MMTQDILLRHQVAMTTGVGMDVVTGRDFLTKVIGHRMVVQIGNQGTQQTEGTWQTGESHLWICHLIDMDQAGETLDMVMVSGAW